VDHGLVIPELTLAQGDIESARVEEARPLRQSPSKSFGVVGLVRVMAHRGWGLSEQ